MMRLQDMKILIFSLFISAVVGHGIYDDETHHKMTRKISKRMKMMSKSLENVVSMLDTLQSQKDQCEASVANMTKELQKLSDKIIDDNIGGVTSGPPHIDLTDEEDRSDGKPVRVDVTSAFDDCMKSLDLDVMPKENAYIWCLRLSLWQFNHNYSDEYEDDSDLEILQVSDNTRSKRSARFIRRRLAPRDMTQPPSGFRIRREYRTLTRAERRRFHDALNVLYEDGTIDCFSRVHRNAIRSSGAHGGVAFLPWHRAFLALFEEALRQVDTRVFIPYWDSSIDDNMEAGPALSVMWDNEHLGPGNGVVNSGPFAGWVTPQSPLRREIARGTGSLIRQSRIDTAMLLCRLGDFTRRWENAHNGVHRWVGGTMARSFAASDPVFYMHHAFVDYQWEKFREHQINDCDIDPAFDYPPTSDENHDAEQPMDGMRFLINRDGIADYWTTNWYNYEDTPTCDTNCGDTPDMFCDPIKDLCTGEIRFDLNNGGRKKRQARQTPPPSDLLNQSNTSSVDCRNKKNLYAQSCYSLPRPRTEEEYADSILRGEIVPPREIEMIEARIQMEIIEFEKTPPDSEPIFFQAPPDDRSDCRTMETCVRDLVFAVIRGFKVTGKGYSGF
ncbi:tyrosinase-like protein [Mercenaria mercenaria]|uniref:tyrosinase-like protein n=1 Tax=Mercenaria mercenaria TaxID=6596 RepID=UPI00234FB103|nr:tyrosinase-like protein [Mercenaria mercenaria]